ncbi:MAG: 4'-phosphopantetheinyl transferase superfamily protein [Acetatifactor sp.]
MIQVYLLAVSELRRRMEEIMSAGKAPKTPGGAGGDRVRQTVLDGGRFNMETLPGWEVLAPWQQEKICRRAQTGARALSMGGQLLLQYGAHRRRTLLRERQGGEDGERQTDGAITWERLSYPRLLENIWAPLPLQAAYGLHGKPYIADVPWHYNLSHSGDYVALAMGDAPVGIDIQQMRPYRDTLVRRFFAEREAAAYERTGETAAYERTGAAAGPGERLYADRESAYGDRTAFFYMLWCRKEAYGKLRGTGLTEDVLKRNMLEDVDARLYEYSEIPGYRVCVCSEAGCGAGEIG